MIKIIIAGFRGKMGQATLKMVLENPDFEVVGLLSKNAEQTDFDGIPVYNDLTELSNLTADVWIDFTEPASVYENTKFALEHNIRPVIGTTGLTETQLAELTELSRTKKLGGLIAPNFAIGAVLLMQFAKSAARYLPDVEIIELHHDNKKDAPSGTALKTAELMKETRNSHLQGATNEVETIAGARGANVDGMRIHSVRLPGLVAHQEVIFGNIGEGLTLRHDSYDRVSFMTGVALAVREVMKADELKYGLEHFLEL